MKNIITHIFILLIFFYACSAKNGDINENSKAKKLKPISSEKIDIQKDFLYDRHTLEDTYPYNDSTREFQWTKIREGLALLETIQQEPRIWGVLQNNKDVNGRAPLVKENTKDEYDRDADKYGVQLYQSIPLYRSTDLKNPERYGRDGSLVEFISDSADFVKFRVASFDGEWMTPKKYIKVYSEPQIFDKVVFVDRKNQNITTLEKKENTWYIRSMNPVTTGAHNPPFQQPTPTGIFVIQQKEEKMMYYKDGTTDIGGFAPDASRFTNGAYLHGVPINSPHTQLVEFSSTLGTVPRSHMCVRNATSHAKFIYDWGKIYETLVFVIE